MTRTSQLFHIALTGAALALGSGCEGPDASPAAGHTAQGDEALGVLEQDVRGGVEWQNPSGVFEAVGAIPGCTATLVSEYAALTAAHCVSEGANVSFTLPNNRGSITGTAHRHPLFGVIKWFSYDYAVVQFPHSIYDDPAVDMNGLAPLPVYEGALTAGESVLLYGYGGFGNLCNTGGNREIHYAWANIDSVEEDWHYHVDDHNVGICPGDSGGPWMAFIGSKWRVVAVNSWITGGSTHSYGKSSYVANDWIRENTGAPELEGDTWGHCVGYKDWIGGAWLSWQGNLSSLNASWNNRISAVWVKKGYAVELYDYSSYGGGQLARHDGFNGDNCNEFGCAYDLTGTAADNDTSSAKCVSDLEGNTWGHCVLYDRFGDGSYFSTQGDHASFSGQYDWWDNRATHVWVETGHTAELFPGANYSDNEPDHQESVTFDGDQGTWCNVYGCLHDLEGTQLENAASSMTCD